MSCLFSARVYTVMEMPFPDNLAGQPVYVNFDKRVICAYITHQKRDASGALTVFGFVQNDNMVDTFVRHGWHKYITMGWTIAQDPTTHEITHTFNTLSFVRKSALTGAGEVQWGG